MRPSPAQIERVAETLVRRLVQAQLLEAVVPEEKTKARFAAILAHNFEEARKLYADTWLGFSEAELHHLLTGAGFEEIEISVVARESKSPNFQTVFATAVKP